jgi:hypothetical protein
MNGFTGSSVLDYDVAQLRRAQPSLHRFFQVLLALNWRIVVVEELTLDTQMARVLDSNVSFDAIAATKTRSNRTRIERRMVWGIIVASTFRLVEDHSSRTPPP